MLLGVARLYEGKGDKNSVEGALNEHLYALTLVSDPEIKEKNYESSSIYNYMPQAPDDRETIKNTVFMNYKSQHEAFILYLLSFDYALLHNFDKADEEFKRAFDLEHASYYSGCMDYQIESMKHFLAMDEKAKVWLGAKQQLFEKYY